MITGYYKSEFPRNYGVPMRGWEPQNPSTLTISLPLASTETNTIWEAQIITPTADGSAWQLGAAAGETPNIVAFAQNSTLSKDVQSADNLVGLSCSGKFRVATPFFCRTTYSGSGSYSGTDYSSFHVCSYTPGTLVTYCKNDEVDYVSVPQGTYSSDSKQYAKTAIRSAAGFIRPAKTGEPVIGVVVSSLPDVGIKKADGTTFIGKLNYNAVGCDQKTTGALTEAAGAQSTNYYMPGTGIVPLAHTWEDTIDSSAQLNNDYYVVIDTTFSPKA